MSNRIRALLQKAGKTQSDLAKAIGKTSAAVSRYCDGEIVPSPKVAKKIKGFLHVPVSELGLREPGRRGPRSVEGRINRQAVEDALEELGISSAELARRCDLSPQAVSRYLNGLMMPRPRTLDRLQAVLGLKRAQLVESVDPRLPRKRAAAGL